MEFFKKTSNVFCPHKKIICRAIRNSVALIVKFIFFPFSGGGEEGVDLPLSAGNPHQRAEINQPFHGDIHGGGAQVSQDHAQGAGPAAPHPGGGEEGVDLPLSAGNPHQRAEIHPPFHGDIHGGGAQVSQDHAQGAGPAAPHHLQAIHEGQPRCCSCTTAKAAEVDCSRCGSTAGGSRGPGVKSAPEAAGGGFAGSHAATAAASNLSEG